MTCNTSAVAVCCSSELAQFGQQPRILDRDDRLVGKGAHQLDLPLGEWLRPAARARPSVPTTETVTQQRHAEQVRNLPSVAASGRR